MAAVTREPAAAAPFGTGLALTTSGASPAPMWKKLISSRPSGVVSTCDGTLHDTIS